MKHIFTKPVFTASLILLVCLITRAQTPVINTVAGGGTQSIVPPLVTNNVLADSVFLSAPNGVAVDAAGNLFIAVAEFNSVFKADAATNIISVFAGNANAGFTQDGGLADTTALAEPTGVAVDDSGNVYIADFENDRVRKVDALTGIITTIAGNSIPGFIGDNGPAVSAELNGPVAVAVDSQGNVYIADRMNNRIRKVTAATGIITTIAGTGPTNGDGGFSGDGGLAVLAQLAQPSGVAVDHQGNVYIADLSNNRIRKISNDTITTFAGSGPGGSTGTFSGDGGLADTAGIYYPNGVAVDAWGNVYITDMQNFRIRKVSNGIITTYAGNGTAGFKGDGGPADSAEINGNAGGLAVDAAGNLYISDFYNVRVRKVTVSPAGIKNVPAGNGIVIFPNPVQNQLIIQNLQPGTPVIVTNLPGQSLLKITATGNRQIIDVSKLSSGMYFVNGAKFIKN